MQDLIDRQQAIDEVQRIGRLATLEDNDAVIRMSAVEYILFNLPSAQPEQKKGKWERVYLDHVASGERPSIFYCSSCNQCVPFPTNFCPACGSDNRQS